MFLVKYLLLLSNELGFFLAKISFLRCLRVMCLFQTEDSKRVLRL